MLHRQSNLNPYKMAATNPLHRRLPSQQLLLWNAAFRAHHLQRVIAQSRFDGLTGTLTGTHYAQLAGRDEPVQLQWRHTTSGVTKEWYEARCQRNTLCLTTSLGQTETNEVAISIFIGERKRFISAFNHILIMQ